MTHEQAETVARAWIAACEPRLQLDLSRTITRPYGWVLLFAPPPGERGLVGGPSAVLFDRINGDVRAFGSEPLEEALIDYESSIPPGRLTLIPELPPGGNHYRGFFDIIDAAKPIDAATFRSQLKRTMRQGHD
jgi:hypothetical protein